MMDMASLALALDRIFGRGPGESVYTGNLQMFDKDGTGMVGNCPAFSFGSFCLVFGRNNA